LNHRPDSAGGLGQARKIELSDLQKIVGVSEPAISPDGKSIVIIVSRVNWDEDRYDSQLVLVDTATGAQRQLTNIRKGLDSPRWSPSGDRLASLAEAGEGKKAAEQIFVLPVNGGEPQQMTSAPLGVEQFSGARPAPSWPSSRRTNRPIRRRSKSTTTSLKWATIASSIPPLPLLHTSGSSRPGPRSVSPPAPGAYQESRRMLPPPRFPGRRTEHISVLLARPTRTPAMPIKPWSRFWTLTVDKSAN